jgi:hypothetical protein
MAHGSLLTLKTRPQLLVFVGASEAISLPFLVILVLWPRRSIWDLGFLPGFSSTVVMLLSGAPVLYAFAHVRQ